MAQRLTSSQAPDPVELLQTLVRIPSVNPSLPSDPAPTGEGELAQRLAGYLQQRGFEVALQEALPGRPNVVASRKSPGGRCVGLTAHLDTVPVAGMTIPPFDAALRDGCVWGRGSADTKASLAAMLAAVEIELHERPDSLPSLLLLFTCDEEAAFSGAECFVAAGLPRLDGLVIGEPTGLRLVTAHKGVYRVEVHTSGVAAHASAPAEGTNAIYRMAPVVSRLEMLAAELDRRPTHPALGRPTLNVGVISGGTAVNSVPDSCRIQVDRRVLPGETSDAITSEIRSALADLPGVTILEPFVSVPGFAIAPDHPWCSAVCQALGQQPGQTVPYATDASILYNAGIPCVVYGPGEPSAAHTADEHVPVDQVLRAVEGYRAIIRCLSL